MKFKVGQRVMLITGPWDRYNHRKIRFIDEVEPYYKIRDRDGNDGFYQADQLVEPPPVKKKRR